VQLGAQLRMAPVEVDAGVVLVVAPPAPPSSEDAISSCVLAPHAMSVTPEKNITAAHFEAAVRFFGRAIMFYEPSPHPGFRSSECFARTSLIHILRAGSRRSEPLDAP
jgi:hypothetical protein